MSKKEVINVARDIATQHFGINAHDRHPPDPRQEQWNAVDYTDRGTSHSHGSYPANDTYSFYVSYHSFLCAASALLGRVPVVSDPDRDSWAYWVRRHSLTRRDGRWLADRRDPTPLRRRAWVHLPRQEPWEGSGRDEDFVDVLTNLDGPGDFLCVHGTWSDYTDYRTEDLWVHSALVNPATAASLANSLRSVEDSRHFFLPTYECNDAEYSKGPFELLGWILQQDSGDPRLDRFDPHAANIEYPSLGVGSSFATALELLSDTEGRKWWQDHDTSALSVISEVWSNQRTTRRDEPCRYGRRIRASVDLLKQLCRQTGKDLIFCVEIKRAMHRSDPANTSASSYAPRSFKVFLFSADGILHDAEKSHGVG